MLLGHSVPRANDIYQIDSSDEDEDSSSDVVQPSRRRRRQAATSKCIDHLTHLQHLVENTDVMIASKAPTPAVSLPASNSDSDEVYVSSRRQMLTKKQRQRQHQVASGLIPPSQAEVRFSSRSRRGVTNYNEDEEDPFLQEDEDMLTPGDWVVEEDNSPAVDMVLDHRLTEPLAFDKEDLNKKDFEYLIKWMDKAHWHATWENWETLKSLSKGTRKIDNYYKKKVLEHIFYETADSSTPLEDKEKFLIERELAAEQLEEFKKVERIIGERFNDGETEYYVKWRILQYDACTWESESLMAGRSQEEVDAFQQQIDDYLNRTQNLPQSTKLVGGRGPYRMFKDQPSYIKHGQLREFQIKGVNFLCNKWCNSQNVMLADEMGLGKTVQTCAFLNWLRHEKGQQGPFLVVVPLSTMPAWADTFNNWTPDINYVIYNGNTQSRQIIRDYELLVDDDPRKTRFHVLLTTYEYILMDAPFLNTIKWQFLAVDEAHRLKNRESQLYEALAAMKVGGKLLITGTPMQNNLEELRALMDFLMPGQVEIDEEIDLASASAQEQLTKITEAIRPYMLRRTKQVVEKDLPPKTEKIMRVELSDIQLKYYKDILTRNYAELNRGNKQQKHSLLNIMMELKKASNHPFMFPNAEERLLGGSERKEDILRLLVTSSGKMMLLEKLLDKLKRDGHRVLVFSQMVMMLNIMSDYLKMRGYKFQRLDGTMPSAARRQAIDHYNADGSDDFCFILSTRAGGLGINLMTADTVILFDSDWNPQADLQAMARAHRIGQKNPVTVYRFVSKDTVEEEILERARNKLMLEFLTIQRGVTENELQEQLAKKGISLAEPTSADEINRILKRRGQKMFEQTTNQEKLEQLDIDAMLENAELHVTEQPEGITADGGEEFLRSFEYTDVKVGELEWDDIIPKEQLEAIRVEEEERKNTELAKQLAETSGPRQRRKPSSMEEREQRAAKKRARDATKEITAEVESEEDEKDPKRALNETEIRKLLKAYQQWGAWADMKDKIVVSSKLTKRDPEVLRQVLEDVVAESNAALEADKQRIAELEKQANKTLTKKDRKEVVFNFRGVKRNNATTMVERPDEMKLIRHLVDEYAAKSDTKNFRVSGQVKPALDFTCDWGAREDGMLIVGIAKYGWGSWTEIRDDPDLEMKTKCFLEEQRSEVKAAREKAEDAKANKPTQVHLNRRANYLVTLLRHRTSKGSNPELERQIQNHHRNIKKWTTGDAASASPAPSGTPRPAAPPRKREKIRDRALSHSDPRQRDRTGTPDVRHNGDSKRKDRRDDGDSKRRDRRDDDRQKAANGNRKRRSDEDASRDQHKKPRMSNDIHGSPARPRSTLKHEDSRGHRSPDDRKPQAHRPDAPQHRHSNSSSRADKPKTERDTESDRLMIKMLEPVSQLMSEIPKANSSKDMPKDKKASLIRTNLAAIGNFIVKQPEEHRQSLWNYFGHKSFKGASGEKLMTMHRAVMNGIAKEEQEKENTSATNGQSNGDATRVLPKETATTA
jgi:chromodomain-helicase-DNA-binding protein 1